MNEDEFKNYLDENKVESKLITEFIIQIKKYEKYLSEESLALETSLPEKIIEYTDNLVLQDKDAVLYFLRAIMNYANFSKKYDFITKAIDISESYNAMDNLFSRVEEIHGESIRNEIFKDLEVPPLGVHPEKKPEFTKVILKRLEENLGMQKTIQLLSPCLHGRPPDDIEGDKKLLKELGIDGFLEKKHQDIVKRLEKHRDEGTLEFAQKIDDEILQIIRDNPIIGGGIREGNIIYISKIPYKMREFLDAKDDNMRKYAICYCPWVRGAFKNGTDNEITNNFCHCSAGWYKLYWDQIFEQSIRVEPVKSALKGDFECKFAIYLSEEIINSYK